ncbi:uncharacterized protein LMH87_008244 [Akanthomyces muscarius]|uniref:Uncharacterized protein n=1 Tax=Akanthomyces muscarius TaxID=2231603 RepID=A0A9W8QIB8_AKAMU|nr:uncharacterized protein LMH87_008244 [Akanthomyces muscarius]KAJ4159339.1 hypothetical protein LMH87_008244 [Akanthomyces muscarius]
MASSSNVYIDDVDVNKGLWTNWNGNELTGSRKTMAKDTADLLNIFLGIFIVFVEAAFWGYISLALFLRNRRHGRDALHHQLQAVFRNVGSSLGTFTTLLRFSWKVWGLRACWRRTRLPALAAFLCLGFFAGAMPFILAMAMLDSQGVEVLVRNMENCGFWFATFTTSGTTAATLLVNQTQEAVSYVDLCYNRDTPSNACDYHLAQRRLPMLAIIAVPCPFSADVCLSKGPYPAVQWQTDQLDSHVDFGINARPKDRMLLQRTTVCAPLDVDRFTKVTSGAMREEELTGVYFGSRPGQNYTYMVSNYESVAKPAYNIDVVWSKAANGSVWSSTFTPIPELVRNDADVSIVLLNNRGIPIKGTDGPCSDPFFSATNKTLLAHKDYYLPDKPITAIGCTDQYAFGNPVTGQWTEPMSSIDTADWGNFTKDWRLSVGQTAAIASLAWASFGSGGIEGVILGLEVGALLAKKTPGIFTGFQNPLPNEQWKKEVGYWFNIGLAKLQFGLIGIAVGPQDPTLPDLQNALHTFTVGNKKLEEEICSCQKVYSLDHKNYNGRGLLIFLAFGGVIAGVLPWLKHRLLRLLSRKENLALLWNSHSTLQMQRMLIESVASGGAGTWERLEDDVPCLIPHDALAGYLNIEHEENGNRHPKWYSDATAADAQADAPNGVQGAGAPDNVHVADAPNDAVPLLQGDPGPGAGAGDVELQNLAPRA